MDNTPHGDHASEYQLMARAREIVRRSNNMATEVALLIDDIARELRGAAGSGEALVAELNQQGKILAGLGHYVGWAIDDPVGFGHHFRLVAGRAEHAAARAAAADIVTAERYRIEKLINENPV